MRAFNVPPQEVSRRTSIAFNKFLDRFASFSSFCDDCLPAVKHIKIYSVSIYNIIIFIISFLLFFVVVYIILYIISFLLFSVGIYNWRWPAQNRCWCPIQGSRPDGIIYRTARFESYTQSNCRYRSKQKLSRQDTAWNWKREEFPKRCFTGEQTKMNGIDPKRQSYFYSLVLEFCLVLFLSIR